VQRDIDRVERTDDVVKLARLSETQMRWSAFFGNESSVVEEAFPPTFAFSTYSITSLQLREDND